jgi:hypothetical protein
MWGDSNSRAVIPASEEIFWAVGKMVGVPAEVMKLVAALEHVEAIDGLAEVRRTPVDADDRQSVRF